MAVLSIQSYTYNAYSSDDLDMLQSLADHCGGALDRIQTETELRRSKEKGEIFSTLAHRLNSVRTPKEAGFVIAEIADSLLGFDACFIDLYSPEKDITYHVLNIDTVDNQKVEYPASSAGQITPLKRRVLDEGRFLILRETQEERDTQNNVPTIEFGNVSKPSASLMFVPAHKGEKLVGIISLQSYTPQAYTEEDLQTLQDLANHCGGTLERIRIEQAIIQERHRIDIFTELGKKLSASYTPKEAGTIILQAARELIGWDSCFLLLYSESRDYLTPTYSIDLIDGQYREVDAPYFEGTPSPNGYTRKTIQEGKQLILREKTQDVDFTMVPFGDRSRRSASLMFVPINAGEEVIGVLSIQSYAFHAYNRDDLDLLESLAQHCSGALERIRVEEERKNLEEQIQHAQKMESLGVLAGGIAHDFNNLLMSILGNADLVLLDLPDDSPLRDSLIEIEKASRRAADLCNQMLAYSGKGRFIVQAVNVTEIVEEMAHLLKVSISKKIDLQYRFSINLPSTKADVTQLRQIIMNLITNASEAIGDTDGAITLTTGVKDCDRNYLRETYLDDDLTEGSYVYIEVTDTGCGMSEETIQKIFDPFFTTKFTGRGLGLAAVLGIVRGHHGALKVDSTVGQGTTFRVLLPALSEPVPARADLSANKKLWKGQGTVLLVDDEKSILKIGKRMLEQIGFDVLTATDGHEALVVFRGNKDNIDCVLLDLTMPNMDGKETYHELLKIREDLRVVLCSGYTEKEIEDRFSEEGLAGFIQKPYKLNKLSAKMQEIFQGKK